jgi:hypothetical protein
VTLLVLVVLQTSWASEYYVATNGSDTANNGLSVGAPYQTIQKAASVMGPGDTCFIRGGLYRETVTPANSGDSSSPITFTNYNGESVLISGLDEVPDAWSPDTGDIYQVGATLLLGSKNQVFIDGEMAQEARWPNNTGSFTCFTTARPSSDGTQSPDGNTNYLTNTDLPFSGSADLDGASLWIAPGLQWVTYVQPIRDYSPATKTIAYDAPIPGDTSWMAQTDDFFYLFGSKAFLDAENEWWYDEDASVLYLQAPGGVDPGELTVEVKARELGFDLQYHNHIIIGGLNLKGCRINANMANGIKLYNLNCQYVAYDAAARTEGIYLRGSGCEVRNCEIAYSSANLLNLELSSNGTVVNNYVHDGGSLFNHRLFKAMGAGHIVSHNTICDSPGTLVRLEMQGGVFQYNHVFNGCWALRDCGLMYNNYTDGQNAVVQRNVFHDNQSESLYMSHAVYYDGGTSDYIFYRNIFYSNHMTGLKINSPFHHLVYNNTSYNTSRYAVRYKDFASTRDMASDRPDGAELVNNLMTCNNITLDSGDPIERNPYSARNYDPLINNPNYVDEDAQDFRLTANSAARDKGSVLAGVTDGYEGEAPDLGALEYGEAMFPVGHDFSSSPDTDLLVMPDLTVFKNRNRVLNGSLEYGASPWTQGDAATLGRIYQISSAPDSTSQNGFYSARLGPAVDSIRQTVPDLEPNMRYVASVWAKAEPGQTAEFSVSDYGGSALTVSTTETNWVPLDIWFTNGPASSSATLTLKKSNPSGSRYVYMDLCALKRSPEPLLPAQPNRLFFDFPEIVISNAAHYSVSSSTIRYQFLEAPAGATISSDGVIAWQPFSTDVPGLYRFTTVAQDAGLPALASTNTFLVTLLAGSKTLLYEGFVAGTDNDAGEYIPNPGNDTSGRHKLIAGQNPEITGFSNDWNWMNGAQYELGTSPLPSLSYPGISTTGNVAFRKYNYGGSSRALDATNAFRAFHTGSGQIGKTGTTLYAGFLMKLDDAANAGSLGVGGEFGFDDEVRVRADGENFVFRANYIDSPDVVPTDADTHLFVVKMEFGDTDTVTFWMDPADLDVESNSTPITTIAVGPSGSVEFSFLTLERGAGSTGGNGVLFDEIRFSSGWDESLFQSTSAAPPLPAVPTKLLWNLTGTNLHFDWPAEYTGWVLQYQANSLVSNAWKDLPASTITNAWEISTLPEVDSAFFRLRFP